MQLSDDLRRQLLDLSAERRHVLQQFKEHTLKSGEARKALREIAEAQKEIARMMKKRGAKA